MDEVSNQTSVFCLYREESPERFESLIAIAKYYLKHEMKEWPASDDIPLEAIEFGVANQLLKVSDNRVCFADAHTELDALAECVAATICPRLVLESTSVWDLVKECSPETSFKNLRPIVSRAFIIANNETSFDMFQFVEDCATSGRIWDVYDSFCSVLPALDASAEQLAHLLPLVADATCNDLTSGQIYAATKSTIERRPALAERLVELLAQNHSETAKSLIPTVIRGLSDSDANASMDMSDRLISDSEVANRRAGVASLGTISYQDDIELIKKAEGRLADLLQSGDPELHRSLAFAFGNLIDLIPGAGPSLLELATHEEFDVLAQVVDTVWRRDLQNSDFDWLWPTFMKLVAIPPSAVSLIEKLDWTLAELCERTPSLVSTFLTAWVETQHSNSVPSAVDVIAPFDATIEKLRNSAPNELSEMITRWLLRSSLCLHAAAAQVTIYMFESLELPPAVSIPSERIIHGLADVEISSVVHALLGHTMHGNTLCRAFLTIWRAAAEKPVIMELVQEVFVKHIGYNYPLATKEFFDAIDLTGNEHDKRLASEVRVELEQYRQPLRGLHQIKELEFPASFVKFYDASRQKSIHESQKSAREQSPLLSAITRVPLKCGRRWFSDGIGGFSDPSSLSTIEHSFEVPRGTMIDPLGISMLRTQWRIAAMREEDETSHS